MQNPNGIWSLLWQFLCCDDPFLGCANIKTIGWCEVPRDWVSPLQGVPQ